MPIASLNARDCLHRPHRSVYPRCFYGYRCRYALSVLANRTKHICSHTLCPCFFGLVPVYMSNSPHPLDSLAILSPLSCPRTPSPLSLKYSFALYAIAHSMQFQYSKSLTPASRMLILHRLKAFVYTRISQIDQRIRVIMDHFRP